MELVSQRELKQIKLDVKRMIDNPQTRTEITYHSLGTISVDEEGDKAESGGVDVTGIYAARISPKSVQDMETRVEDVTDILLVYAEDLGSVVPKVKDYILIGTTKKYIKDFDFPFPEIHYKFFVGSKGK